MSPLLVWALRLTGDLAPDILAAWAETRRLQSTIAAESRPGGRKIVRAYFDHLRITGSPLPTYTGHHRDALRTALTKRRCIGRDPEESWTPVACRFIAGLLGVSAWQVGAFIRENPHALEGISPGTGAALNVTIAGKLDGEPWTNDIDYEEATDLALHLGAAAAVVIAYLSGMRPEEVLHLRRGCCTIDDSNVDGIARYQVSGRHFKGVTDDNGNTDPAGGTRPHRWTVIQPVHTAINVLEALTEEDLLLPRALSKTPRPLAYHGQALTTPSMNARIKDFIAWANDLALRHGRPHEVIPDDPVGPVTMRRFRRTVAWFINRLPGGRIALGIQYGHLQMSESYGGRSSVDMLELLDLEQALTTANTLADAAERLSHGEGVSGPAAERYVASAAEFTATYAGGFLSKRQHKALLANPHLQVFDHPQAMLACNKDPFKALCDPERGKPGRPAARRPKLLVSTAATPPAPTSPAPTPTSTASGLRSPTSIGRSPPASIRCPSSNGSDNAARLCSVSSITTSSPAS